MGDTANAPVSACLLDRWSKMRASDRHRVHLIFRCSCARCHEAVRAGLLGEAPTDLAVKERWRLLVAEPAAVPGRAER
jgi:hypothetical protein